jgi:hypothetical protein
MVEQSGHGMGLTNRSLKPAPYGSVRDQSRFTIPICLCRGFAEASYMEIVLSGRQFRASLHRSGQRD